MFSKQASQRRHGPLACRLLLQDRHRRWESPRSRRLAIVTWHLLPRCSRSDLQKFVLRDNARALPDNASTFHVTAPSRNQRHTESGDQTPPGIPRIEPSIRRLFVSISPLGRDQHGRPLSNKTGPVSVGRRGWKVLSGFNSLPEASGQDHYTSCSLTARLNTKSLLNRGLNSRDSRRRLVAGFCVTLILRAR